MKYLKLPRLRPADRPLEYVPEHELREAQARAQRAVPLPAHLSVR